MVFRLLNYKLDETEYIKEIATIKTIDRNNGYNQYLIENLITRTKNKNKRPTTNNSSESISNRIKTNFLSLHYTDENSFKIGNIFKKLGFNPASVSYTHLDVYKRQELTCVSTSNVTYGQRSFLTYCLILVMASFWKRREE